MKGKGSKALVTTTDIYATVLDLVGAKQPWRTRKSSISFADTLKFKKYSGLRRFLVAERGATTITVGGGAAPNPNEGG